VTIAFALTKHHYLIAVFFLAHFILTSILFVLLNIFVESFTPRGQTGLVRGVFLTLYNTGILISPLIGGLILTQNFTASHTSNFTTLYIIASLILVPYFFFLHHYLKEIKDPPYKSHSMFDAFFSSMKNKNLRAALVSQFALQAFYVVMVIYTPLHITQMLHIDISIYLLAIAPISLLPLVILPYELGYLADAKYGEKEFLIAGLSLIGITTFFLGIIETSSVLFIITLLFFSRVGAALVETMAYTYYYKKISRDDPAMTNLFTNLSAFASCVVPFFFFLISPLVTLYPNLIFIVLGTGILSTIHSALQMKDTK
jgi:MFS family permease